MGFITNYARNLLPMVLGGQPVRPLLFSYYITHRCRLNCRYCCDGEGRRFNEERIPELPTTEAQRLISILARATDTLDVTGGEPLLREDLENLLAHARRCGFRTILNTKGIGLEERPELLRLVDGLVLSLDTLEPEKLARLIGRPVKDALAILTALEFVLKKRPETKLRLVISCVATPDNLAEVAQVLSFTQRERIGFHLSPEIQGTQANPELVGNPQYRELIDRVREAKRMGAGVLGIDRYFNGIRNFARFRCHPLLMPVICPDGRLYYPCLESKQAEVNLLQAGDYPTALHTARARHGGIPECGDCCHIFCHMALSLLQRHPYAALCEMKHWKKS